MSAVQGYQARIFYTLLHFMRHPQRRVTVLFTPYKQRRLVYLRQNGVLISVYYVDKGGFHQRRKRLIIGRTAAGRIGFYRLFQAVYEFPCKFFQCKARLYARPIDYHKRVNTRIGSDVQRHSSAERVRHDACRRYVFIKHYAPHALRKIPQRVFSCSRRIPVSVEVHAYAAISIFQYVYKRRK